MINRTLALVGIISIIEIGIGKHIPAVAKGVRERGAGHLYGWSEFLLIRSPTAVSGQEVRRMQLLVSNAAY